MDSLGVQGGTIPGLAPGGMVPVLNMGNLGDNFAAQVFESRGIASTMNTTGPGSVGRYLLWALHSRAAGGSVIEACTVRTVDAGDVAPSMFAPNLAWMMNIADTTFFTGGTTTMPYQSVGGPTPRNEFSVGYSVTPISLIEWQLAFPPDFDQGAFKMWVPPGQFINFLFHSENNNVLNICSAMMTIQWREIPEVQGVSR